MPDAIVIRGLRKTFGAKVAVDHLDLTIPQGSMHGLIGPNGAGKTTTIRMIMSIIFPDSGELSVLGKSSAVESKDRIGYLPEERGVYKKMRVLSFLKHIGRLKGMDSAGLDRKVRGWLERVDLADSARKKCEELSKGMQQKVQFIASVIHEPDLIILDEPFSGLDPVNTRLLRDLFLEQHRAGRTVIFSTHVMFQAEQLCDRIVMIHQGRKVLDDTMSEIRSRYTPRSILFEPVSSEANLSTVSRVPGVEGVSGEWPAYEAAVKDGADTAEVLSRIAAAVPVARVELKRPTLEDVFIQIVQGGTGDGDAAALRAALRAGEPAAVGAGR
jgi:ABC-2 type transport system ATP-binding protein